MNISDEVLQAARQDMRHAMRLKAAFRVTIVGFAASVIWFWWLV